MSAAAGLQTKGRNGRIRVALTAGTSAQLVVDTAAFVAFRTDDVQAACFHYFIVFCLPAVLECGDLRQLLFVVQRLWCGSCDADTSVL